MSCAATGIVTAWLAVERTMQAQVLVHPRNAAAGVHTEIDRAEDFERGSFPNELVVDSGPALPASLPAMELYPAIDERTARVHTSRIQTFSARVFRIHYANSLASGVVNVVGRAPAVSESSNWDALKWRRSVTLVVAAVALVAAIALRFVYTGRHEWFSRFGQADLVFGCSSAAAILLAWCAALAMHAPRARGNALRLSAVATMIAFIATAISFGHARPSAAAARAALRAGDIDGATVGGQALIDLRIDPQGGRAVLDEIQAARVSRAASCREKATLARLNWHSQDARARSVGDVIGCVERESSSAYQRSDAGALTELAGMADDLDSPVAEAARWLADVVGVCGVLGRGEVPAAKDALDRIATNARGVPEAMAPSNVRDIAAAAARLRDALAKTKSSSRHAQRDALAAAIDDAIALKQILPAGVVDPTPALATRLQAVRRQLARAERKPSERVGDRSPESSDPERPPPARSNGSDVLNPY